MKLQKHTTREIDGKEYYKWVITIPPRHIKRLKWEEGMELESNIEGVTLLINPINKLSKKPQKMTYEKFKEIVQEELNKEPEGLSWTEIKNRRSELYQRVPNNLWVRTLEQEIGLAREKKGSKTIWKIKK